jgi:PqqD family protein of HPr-rel-A system
MSDAHDHPISEAAVAVPTEYRPRKAADVLELDMGDGIILYNHDSNLVHHLNPSAAILWQLCDGDGSVEQLALEVAEEYGLDHPQVEREIVELIAELDALGLVEDAGAAGRNQ